MPKGLFLYIHDADKSKNLGVFKKMYGQIDALRRQGVEIDFVLNTTEALMLNNSIPLYVNPTGVFKKLHEIYRFITGYFNILLQKTDFSACDFIYLRHSYFNHFLISFLKTLRKKYPKLKIFLEIPTYPYDKEFNTFLRSPVLWLDRKYRKQIPGLVDKIITYTNDDEIYQTPAIKVANGIKIDPAMAEMPAEKQAGFAGRTTIYAVAIAANISYWHAFDRAIQGLYQYYRVPRDVVIHLEIIGGGNEIENLKKLARDLSLGKYIKFTDHVKDELENLLQHKDFSIGTLGMFRKNVAYDSSLKSREYCYHGLPFVLCTPDLCFDPSLPYWYYASNDEQPLPFDDILRWLIDMERAHPDYKSQMRDFACQTLTWNSTFRNFIDHLKNVLP